MKEKLLKLRERFTREQNDRKNLRLVEDKNDMVEGEKEREDSSFPNHSKGANQIDLDDKVDAFLDWYFKNMVQGHYSKSGEYHKRKEMKDLIEKMAVWYELRYPDYEVNR